MENFLRILKIFSASLFFIGGGFASNWGNKFGDFTKECNNNQSQICFLRNSLSAPSFRPLIVIVILTSGVQYVVFELDKRITERQNNYIEERIRRETIEEMKSTREYIAGVSLMATKIAETETERANAETALQKARSEYQEISMEVIEQQIQIEEGKKILEDLRKDNN